MPLDAFTSQGITLGVGVRPGVPAADARWNALCHEGGNGERLLQQISCVLGLNG